MTEVTPPQAVAPTAQEPHSSVVPALIAANTILVVDDNTPNAELVSEILGMHGFHVQITETAEAAIPMARALRPALILMDINLPGMNGFAATKILKDDPATRHAIVIGLSGEIHDSADTVFDGYLGKPFEIQSLISSVKSFLSRPAHSALVGD